MATAPNTLPAPGPRAVATPALHDKMNRGPGAIGILIFGVVLIIGVIYAGASLTKDLSRVHTTSILPYILLGIALLGGTWI